MSEFTKRMIGSQVHLLRGQEKIYAPDLSVGGSGPLGSTTRRDRGRRHLAPPPLPEPAARRRVRHRRQLEHPSQLRHRRRLHPPLSPAECFGTNSTHPLSWSTRLTLKPTLSQAAACGRLDVSDWFDHHSRYWCAEAGSDPPIIFSISVKDSRTIASL